MYAISLNHSNALTHHRYRSLTPKSRLVPLSEPFLDYLRSDGIVLPAEEDANEADSDDPDNNISAYSNEEEGPDPAAAWLDIHQTVKCIIAELDGSIVPKLNWSAPKDATWISATNSMECRTPNDIYLLLKSSDFVTHDLEHAFDDCESDHDDGYDDETAISPRIPYHLVLRKTIPSMTTSLEFRCFVRARHLLCISQREVTYYAFLADLKPALLQLIQKFFESKLQKTFPDANFVFDVYVPLPQGRVWLIDINPWAPRTDPLLFSWLEILEMTGGEQGGAAVNHESEEDNDTNESLTDDSEDEFVFEPEFRLIRKDDPEAYNFNTQQYSAHKLPKDVVDASANEAGIRDFLQQWRQIIAAQEREDAAPGVGDQEA